MLALLGAAVIASAAPIRVGILTGVGQNRYWHTNQHTAANAIISILAAPDTAGLGSDLMTLPDGFVVTRFGPAGTATGTPSVAQRQAFIDALDTLDVIVFTSNTDIPGIFTDPLHREKLEGFWKAKGTVSIHFSVDTWGTWPSLDSLQGARFQNHPNSDRTATLRLDTLAQGESAWRLLNQGIADTTFLDEWLSFMTNGDVIRAAPGLKVLVNIDESTYTGGMGGARAMGDHPMAWYRQLPEGGRFFYTAVGHRAQHYLGGSNNVRFLRRQLYNALLWTAGYNEDGSRTAVGVHGRSSARNISDAARLFFTGSTLSVSILTEGPHAVEVRGLDGRSVAARRGEGRASHEFQGLRSGAVYVVSVARGGQRLVRLVTTP
jgi:type 1 glutamine amidotransferase